MKKIVISVFTLLMLAFGVSAQIDRSVRPEPGPAPVIQLGDFDTFTMDNGMKVIVVENRQVPVLSFQLTLDVDPVLEGEAKGFVDLGGALLRDGTTNRSKEEIDETIDFIGASLNTFSSGMFASSLTRHKETLLELMSDILLNPSFPESELERSLNQNISGLSTVKTDANAMVRNVRTAMLYPNHPYGEVTTEESLNNVNVDLIKEYYQTFFKPNVAYMVIVGDIDVDEAKALMEKYFAQWEPAEVPNYEYDTPTAPEGIRVAFAERMGAVQSVVSIAYPLYLTPGHEDAIKVSVMNSILGGGVFSGRLMQNLREDKGYTYGARSNISTDRLIGSFTAGAEVRNSVTDSTVVEIFHEMDRMRNEQVDEESLQLVKNYLTGSFARSLESPRTMARFALNIERYGLPEDYYATYLEKLNAVTADDVMDMARKYLKPENAYIIVSGNKEEVPQNLTRFAVSGEVEFYDAFGRPLIEAELVEVGDDMNIDTVLENYFNAIGGRDKMEQVNDMVLTMRAQMMGQEVSMKTYRKSPDLYLMETSMGGMVVSKQLFDGEKAIVVSPMGKQEFAEGVEYEMMRSQSIMNAELHYKEHGIQKTLAGIETVQGKPCYKVEVVANGIKSFDYYDVGTSLKIQTDSQQGSIIFDEYREFEGLLFPTHLKQQMGPQMIDVIIEGIEINTGIEPDVFQVD